MPAPLRLLPIRVFVKRVTIVDRVSCRLTQVEVPGILCQISTNDAGVFGDVVVPCVVGVAYQDSDIPTQRCATLPFRKPDNDAVVFGWDGSISN